VITDVGEIHAQWTTGARPGDYSLGVESYPVRDKERRWAISCSHSMTSLEYVAGGDLRDRGIWIHE